MRSAYIVTALRTAVGKAKKGTLKDFRPDEMLSTVISELVQKTPNLNPAEIDDVIIGCAFPEGEQGLNIARIASLRAGLPVNVPAITINRFCSSGLQSIAFAAERIMLGHADIIIAGGVESMSLVPMTGNKFSANPYLAENYPEVYISMGLTAERVAEKYQITRQMQDEFALKSHQKALKAIQDGKFKDEIVPLKVVNKYINGKGEKIIEEKIFDTDEGPRADTSLEKLAQIKPAFKEGGTVTAGNSSQMSDGAAGVVVMSEEKVKELGLKPIARFVSFAVAGVPPEIMGIGPVEAIPKALKLAGLKLEDIGLIELNEAFAAQTLAVIKLAGLNEEIINVNGGAIALGHPLGCTGAKLTVTLLNEMRRKNVKYGMVTMCIGGGMGAAGIFELV